MIRFALARYLTISESLYNLPKKTYRSEKIGTALTNTPDSFSAG
jgi:hypothetical protein